MIDTSLLHIPRSKKIFLNMFVYALKLPGPLCSGKDWGAEVPVDWPVGDGRVNSNLKAEPAVE